MSNYIKLIKVALKKNGIPLYIYDTQIIENNIKKISSCLVNIKHKVYFATMCNNVPEILKIMKKSGIGIHINSEHELDLVKAIGFNGSDISFTSTGVSTDLMRKLVNRKVGINLDSVEEVEKFCKIVKNRKFGIRIKIPKAIKATSNKATNKSSDSNVGIDKKDFDSVRAIAKKSNNKIVGIHGYFASNVQTEKPFIKFGNYLAEVATEFPDLEYVNFGSGFGIKYSDQDSDLDYKKVLTHYSLLVNKVSKKLNKQVILKIEPGRVIAGSAGQLLVRVTNVKKIDVKKFEIAVNAGFAEFARPRIYSSYHKISNLEKNNKKKIICDVRGNTVLQDDFLARNIILNEVKEGDYLVIENVGAYGMVMASGFPGKVLPRQVLIKDKSFKLL